MVAGNSSLTEPHHCIELQELAAKSSEKYPKVSQFQELKRPAFAGASRKSLIY
jgi:hypothetical protein